MRGEFEVLVHHHDDERSTEGHPQRLGRNLNWGGGEKVSWVQIIISTYKNWLISLIPASFMKKADGTDIPFFYYYFNQSQFILQKCAFNSRGINAQNCAFNSRGINAMAALQ